MNESKRFGEHWTCFIDRLSRGGLSKMVRFEALERRTSATGWYLQLCLLAIQLAVFVTVRDGL
jgi:hypothetical protein